MKDYIEKLRQEKQALMKKVDAIDNAINAFQDVCEHKLEDGKSALEYTGHDSHKDYYKCKICGFKDKE